MDTTQPRIPGYEIIGRAGTGTYSRVYLARELRSGCEVAIKHLDATLVDYSQELRYAKRLQEISSPHLASLLDFGRDEAGTYFLVLEWGGRELYDWLAEQGQLAPASAYLALRQAAEGIRTLQRAGFVHLDISPGNLFIDEAASVRVSDFGMCVTLTGRSRRLDSKPRGTPGYTAPEVLRGVACLTSDIYSLGAVLHWMLTARAPIGNDESGRPKKLLPGLPRAAEWIISKSLHSDPDKRFQTLAELQHQLDRAIRGTWREPRSAGGRRASNPSRIGLWRRIFGGSRRSEGTPPAPR